MGLIAHRIKGACCYCGVPKFEESIRKLHLLLKSRAALEVPAEKDTLLDDSINALVLIVNHDATNLIDWHLGHRNPFFKQLDDQGLG